LKHRADKEDTGLTQMITYIESTLYFIVTGILLERTGGTKEAYNMYHQTSGLIRSIAIRPRTGSRPEYPQETKLMPLM
jgi:hypothetical protein